MGYVYDLCFVANIIRMQTDNKNKLLIIMGLIGVGLVIFIYSITIASVYQLIKSLTT